MHGASPRKVARIAAWTLAATLALVETLSESTAQPKPALPAPLPARASVGRCGLDMADVGGLFCIDRFESSLVDKTSGRRLSPYYHPNPSLAERDRREWQRRSTGAGRTAARAIELPELPAWQIGSEVEAMAVSEAGRIPNAYLDLEAARRACQSAGKRLCKKRQWLMACRSERGTRHPYGDEFDVARCNLAAPIHPGVVLHGKAALDGRDPRLNLVAHAGRPLLRPTGTLLGCASSWEGDAVWDMAGNLDEWIDDPAGTFVGGFYARDTHWGCDARVEIHSADYYDYSLGARCCKE